MDNRIDDLATALHELTAQRDDLLRDQGTISPDRLQRLHRVLASELLVETALSVAALKRDELRGLPKPGIPAPVEALLAAQLRFLRPTLHSRRESFRRSENYRGRLWALLQPEWIGVATALVVVSAGVLHFGSWGKPARGVRTPEGTALQVSAEPPEGAVVSAHQELRTRPEDSFFSTSGNHLNLRVSTIELASLRPSLLTINGDYFPDRSERDSGLRLDLPVRQILIDAESGRTP